MHFLASVPPWAMLGIFGALIFGSLLKPSELDQKGERDE